MNKRKKTSACAICLAVSLMIPALAAGNYTDVANSAWYGQAVRQVSEKGFMTGTTETTFSPTTAVTRATVVTVLWRMEDAPAAAVDTPFTDVQADAWYEDAASWAKGKGIAAGNGVGAFSPDSPVTREQLAVFLYNYARYKGGDLAQGKLELYTDQAKVSKWAVEGMRHAVGAGLVRGSENNLDPVGKATRAELAVILQRLMTPVMG